MKATRQSAKIFTHFFVLGLTLQFSLGVEAKRAQPERFRNWTDAQTFVQVRAEEFRLQSGADLGEYRFQLNPSQNFLRSPNSDPRRGQHGLNDEDWTAFNSIRFTILNFVMKVLELPFLPIGTTVMVGSTIGFRRVQDSSKKTEYTQDRGLEGLQLHRKRAIRSILRGVDSAIFLARESIARSRSFVLPLVIGFDEYNLGIQIGYHLPDGESLPRIIMDTIVTAPVGGVPMGVNTKSTAGGNVVLDGLQVISGASAITVGGIQGIEVTATSNQGSVSISSVTSALLPLLLGGEAASLPMSFNSGSTTIRTRVYLGEVRNHFVVFRNRIGSAMQTLRINPANVKGQDLESVAERFQNEEARTEGSDSSNFCLQTFRN